ncbi:MAG TPA: IclR family transcriptional regulator [Gaiellaceae bacterium]|nr:IclR family transcriptional regulator [Gaiellaceae bacterium]
MQSADKALAILAAFTDARPELGATELAGELGIHKSTVSRLLATLERRGLVRRAGDRFLPGPELARLGSLAARGLALLPTAREPLVRLAGETGETVNLAIREGDRVLNVHQVETSHYVGVKDWTGRTTPLDTTANGKVLLAFGEGDGDVSAELERIRGCGYATAVEELERGLNSAAAPVFDCTGACVAAVSVAGPSYRVTERRLADLGLACVAAADEISAGLGHRRAA